MQSTRSNMILVASQSDRIDLAACQRLLSMHNVPFQVVHRGIDCIIEVPREFSSQAIDLVLENRRSISHKRRVVGEESVMAIVTGGLIGAMTTSLGVFAFWDLLSPVACVTIAAVSVVPGALVGGLLGLRRYKAKNQLA